MFGLFKEKEKTFKEKYYEELEKQNFGIKFISYNKKNNYYIFDTFEGKYEIWSNGSIYLYGTTTNAHLGEKIKKALYKERERLERIDLDRRILEDEKREKEKFLKEEEEYQKKYLELLKVKPLDKDLQEAFRKSEKLIELGKEAVRIHSEILKLKNS